MTLEYRIGDVFERLAEIPDGSIDLVVTSPPFLALRSYLPADHPDKAKEIGSEPTPAEFLDTLYALSAEWARVLAPHGSICVELGDTFSGNNESGFHRGSEAHTTTPGRTRNNTANGHKRDLSSGWPLAKSLTGIPTLYPWGLAYGRNLLTGQPHDAGQWRIRNLIVWARPNPPVGALGDKFRPATSYITVACKGQRRYFDLDAVRTELAESTQGRAMSLPPKTDHKFDSLSSRNTLGAYDGTRQGAPPLDWHADDHPEDGDWLWKLSTQPYKGSHYATFPLTLPKRLIEAMCPLKVCTVCGKPSERITGEAIYNRTDSDRVPARLNLIDGERVAPMVNQHGAPTGANTSVTRSAPTLGWTDCDCPDRVIIPGTKLATSKWRTGIVLDPFAGSGTTLEAAQAVGRHAIGIDLDSRNADLARERVGMFLNVEEGAA